jgi:hypothetical protein
MVSKQLLLLKWTQCLCHKQAARGLLGKMKVDNEERLGCKVLNERRVKRIERVAVIYK